MILILRGGILMSIGNLPEHLSQAILVGIMLVVRFGVPLSAILFVGTAWLATRLAVDFHFDVEIKPKRACKHDCGV